ncbi:serine/threonine protein kinase [Myxococcota bacterium]|nr:serine/threonine protein kinase [Myxococcota bacterium]
MLSLPHQPPPAAPQLAPRVARTALDRPVEPVARRYRAVEPLGQGGQGRVWAAVDELTGQRVALKLVPLGAGDEAARREVAVLRALRLPGVVRLLDEGRDGPWRYLVTELADGRPFPGLPRPAPWSVVAEPTRQLLRVLGQVHRAGVVHGDLKPGNVLVGADGRVRLLDFGLAHASASAARQAVGATVGGTLHYLAPEVIDGRRPGRRSDLFALGVLLVRTLADHLPWPATDLPGLVAARALPPDLDGVPDALRVPIGRLLERDPSRRPADAREAMALLGLDLAGPALTLPWSADGPCLAPVDLAVAFRGPERILHLPTDAAEILHARTGGARDRVAQELQAWVDEGLAEVEGAYLRVERAVLDHLAQGEGGHSPSHGGEATGWTPLARLIHEESASTAQVVDLATSLCRHALSEGRLGEAMAIAEVAFLELREARFPGVDPAPLLGLYTRAAVDTASPVAADRAAWELRRLPPLHGREALAALLDAMRLALLGHAEEALEIAVALPPFVDPDLAALVPAVQASAARALPVEAEEFVLEQVEAWCARHPSPDGAARCAFWRGHLRRRQGRFAEAAALFDRAARAHPDAPTRLQARVEAARAWLGAGDLALARRVARRALAAAAEARDPTREALALWLTREVARREGVAVGPDIELVDSVAGLGDPLLLGRVALLEATVAWTAGMADTGRVLARRARGAFHAAGHPPEAVLAAALAAAVGDDACLWWAREHFPQPEEAGQAQVLHQAAALMYRATGLPSWAELGRALGGALDRDRVGEVLTVAEAEAILDEPVGRG